MLPLWKTTRRFLKKLKIELPYKPTGYIFIQYNAKILIQKDTCTPVFTAALITIAKMWKQPKCPSTDKWIKIWHMCMYVYVEYYLIFKKNEILHL